MSVSAGWESGEESDQQLVSVEKSQPMAARRILWGDQDMMTSLSQSLQTGGQGQGRYHPPRFLEL
jgi:hypothetical protein